MEQMVDVQRSPAQRPGYVARPQPPEVFEERPVAVPEARPGEGARPMSLAAEVATTVAVERHAVAMTFATFLFTLAAALMYQGAASRTSEGGFIALGLVSFLGALSVAFLARRRLRARLLVAAARVSARRDAAR